MTTTEDHQEPPIEVLEYHKQLLDYQDTAYEAAERGDYDTAVNIWTAILTDAPTREFFEQSHDALMEIAWNLAVVHSANGNQELALTIFEQWGFQPDEYQRVLSGGENA